MTEHLRQAKFPVITEQYLMVLLGFSCIAVLATAMQVDSLATDNAHDLQHAYLHRYAHRRP